MFAGTLVSRVLGFIRSPLLLGAVIGINYPAANSFDIANRLPTLIYMIIAGGVVNAVLVPAIVRAAKRDADGGQSYINKLVTLGTVAIGGITVLLTLAAPLLVKLFAATLSPDWYGLTLAFAYWCIPQVFFYGMYTLLGQILNAKENFGPYMWAPAANNIVAIAGLLLMLAIFGGADPATAGNIDAWTGSKITLLAGTATLGIAVQCLVLIYPLYRIGVRLRPDFQWRGGAPSPPGRAVPASPRRRSPAPGCSSRCSCPCSPPCSFRMWPPMPRTRLSLVRTPPSRFLATLPIPLLTRFTRCPHRSSSSPS